MSVRMPKKDYLLVNYGEGFRRLALVVLVPLGLMLVAATIWAAMRDFAAVARLALAYWPYTLAGLVMLAALLWVWRGFKKPRVP